MASKVSTVARTMTVFDRTTMTDRELSFYKRHHDEIATVSRYCAVQNRRGITIVNDDSPEEQGQGYFRAVQFLFNGATVTARTIFDVQYHFS